MGERMTNERPGGFWGNKRGPYIIFTLFSLLVLGIARLLNPEGSGQGTHEQLGLPPCTFHLITGHGCPGCGLTTSFAYLARGDLSSAFHANPIGVLLFSLVALSVPFFSYRIWRPKPIDDLLTSKWLSRGLIGLMILMFVVWFIRLALGVA